MRTDIDIDGLLAPIPGENPAGEDLRYTQVYDDIKEARRADEPLDMGEWQRDIKTSDWEQVITISLEALEKRSKDLQIAAWLTEALVMEEGFTGLESGLRLIVGLLRDFWDTLYPEAEEGDLEYRVAPLVFLNDKLAEAVRQVPLTDPDTTPGYSWLKWEESRAVGSDADTKNKYGDYDEKKQSRRSEMMAEGKIPAEDFDAAVARSSAGFFRALSGGVSRSLDVFGELDGLVDGRFESSAPRLSDLGKAIEECQRLLTRFVPEERGEEGGKEGPPPAEPQPLPSEETPSGGEVAEAPSVSSGVPERIPTVSVAYPAPHTIRDVVSREEALWEEAVARTEKGGFREALDNLLAVANSQPSERGRNRYRLLVAKLCIKAGRYDLARPIIENLSALIGELQLERWESPLWIAEVLEVLYQCLTSGEPSDDDSARANELFTRICTMDVTKALIYRK